MAPKLKTVSGLFQSLFSWPSHKMISPNFPSKATRKRLRTVRWFRRLANTKPSLCRLTGPQGLGVTSSWKQLLPLAAVNPGGQIPTLSADLHFHSLMSCFFMKNQRQQPNTQKELTLAFNKMPRVAEDSWVNLSDTFSNLFDRGGKRNVILKAGERERWRKSASGRSV